VRDHPGFNVIGHVTGNLGLGVLARNVVRMIVMRGYPVSVLDVDPGLGRGGHDLAFEGLLVRSPDALPYSINLFVLPAPSLHALLLDLDALVLDESRLNVALPMWELSVLPLGWRSIFEFFDVLVAGSTFIRSTLDFSLSNTFVLEGAQPLFLPGEAPVDRRRFGIPEHKIVFLTTYEPHSDPRRKNPQGAVEAFLRALSDDPHACLVVNANNAAVGGGEHLSLAHLRGLAAGCERVFFLTEDYPYADVLSLLASVDVVVSLHRAEGLGLVPMEAMALGKPVIATAWSGNMEYMNHTNACLVDYALSAVPASADTYHQLLGGVPAVWAEPNLVTAAAWMKRLADDAAYREALGRRAREDIEAYNAEALRGAYLEELETVYRHRGILCPKIAERRQRLEKLREGPDALIEREGPTTHLAAAVASNRICSRELAMTQARLAMTQARLSDLLASTSWRVTAPLRSFVTAVRRLGKTARRGS
jgi:glycosyltransferase involved in cell wall biosynthesis